MRGCVPFALRTILMGLFLRQKISIIFDTVMSAGKRFGVNKLSKLCRCIYSSNQNKYVSIFILKRFFLPKLSLSKERKKPYPFTPFPLAVIYAKIYSAIKWSIEKGMGIKAAKKRIQSITSVWDTGYVSGTNVVAAQWIRMEMFAETLPSLPACSERSTVEGSSPRSAVCVG